jgi:translation elongation factor EF-1beta
MRNQTGKQTGVQLEDKLPKGLVNISLEAVNADYDLATLKLIFPVSTEVDHVTLEGKIIEFTNCDSELIFRGKYQIEFLITLLQLMINDSKKEHNYVKNKINYSFDGMLNHKRALSIFTNYASTPESLNDFLRNATSKN